MNEVRSDSQREQHQHDAQDDSPQLGAAWEGVAEEASNLLQQLQQFANGLHAAVGTDGGAPNSDMQQAANALALLGRKPPQKQATGPGRGGSGVRKTCTQCTMVGMDKTWQQAKQVDKQAVVRFDEMHKKHCSFCHCKSCSAAAQEMQPASMADPEKSQNIRKKAGLCPRKA